MNQGTYKVNIVAIDSTAAGVQPSHTLAIKGIRAARNALGDRLNATLKRSKLTYDDAIAGNIPALIGSTDSQELALEATVVAETASQGVLGCEVAYEGSGAENAAGDAGSMRVYKVRVHEDTGEQVFDIGRQANVLEKDALLIEDIVTQETGNPFTLEATTHALIAMATANGVPGVATTYAGSYRRHGDEDLWAEVQDLLEHVFPVDPS